MALHKHLGYTSHTTEVAVDLERRMRVKEIRICTTFLLFVAHKCELIGYELVSMVSVKETSPQTHFPSHAPSCRRISAMYQRCAGGIEKLRCAVRGYLIGRIHAVEMRHVTVHILRVVPITHPFLKLPPMPYTHRRDLFYA